MASERGMISVWPKGTPAGLVAGIAAVGIENVKIFSAAAEGKITAYEAIDRSTRTTVSMSAGLYAAGNGAIIGASVLSWIPVVGQAVGSIVGGTIGYLAGSTVGSAVHSVAKTIARGTVTVVKSAYNSLKSGFSKVTSWIFG